MMFKCFNCGKIKETVLKIIICKNCNNEMKQIPYKPCIPVEIKNPYPKTDIYGQVIQDE